VAGLVQAARHCERRGDAPTPSNLDWSVTLAKEKAMSAHKKTASRFRVGDWVAFLYGTKKAFAQVVEDRGPIGVQGRRLYRIRLFHNSDEPDAFEMPEEYLEAAPAPEKPALVRYLKEGGLVTILQSNLSGGKEQPRVWLTYSSQGSITNTFTAGLGIMGGALVPFFALIEDKIFTAKKKEVLAFLESFGLSRAEAEDVVATVGTAP
jgi:hypothetical protein